MVNVIYKGGTSFYDGLTIGCSYVVIDENENQYVVRNDVGGTSTIQKSKFEVDKHEARMEEILKRSPESCTNILCYISGYLGNSEKFEEAFQSALVDGINIE